MDTDNRIEADRLYQEAKKYNWRDNPGDAALARSLFASAAHLGHGQAKSDLAGMMFFGCGGPKDQEKAIALAWGAFAPNDVSPLEELCELLSSHAEAIADPIEKRRCDNVVEKAEQALELLKYVAGYVHELARSGSST